MPTKALTKESLLAWIEHYEQGNDLPDDIMVQVLYMAQRDVEKQGFKEELNEMIIDEERTLFEAQERYDETNDSASIEKAAYMIGVLKHKHKFFFGD